MSPSCWLVHTVFLLSVLCLIATAKVTENANSESNLEHAKSLTKRSAESTFVTNEKRPRFFHSGYLYSDDYLKDKAKLGFNKKSYGDYLYGAEPEKRSFHYSLYGLEPEKRIGGTEAFRYKVQQWIKDNADNAVKRSFRYKLYGAEPEKRYFQSSVYGAEPEKRQFSESVYGWEPERKRAKPASRWMFQAPDYDRVRLDASQQQLQYRK